MTPVRLAALAAAIALTPIGPTGPSWSQVPGATGGPRPNLAGEIARPVRYSPVEGGFAITDGGERFNRPLYGGTTAFRVDGGDTPEFSVYLPGRGGNLRFAVRTGDRVWWLHDAAKIETRYLPGELIYAIRDPRLGPGTLRVEVLAFHDTEGLIVRVGGERLPRGVGLHWAFGGINGERGARDGDIGTERVPISRYFQPQPGFAEFNRVETGATGFRIVASPATIAGTVSGGTVGAGSADAWDDPARLFGGGRAGERPIATGTLTLGGEDAYLALTVVARAIPANADLAVYRAVSERPTAVRDPARDAAPLARADLAAAFARARADFAALRTRVSIDTPDPWMNAALAATVVAGDATWDDQDRAIMHGAVAWRTKLLGWRGPYLLDALGWHDRARANFRTWFARQNVDPVPASIPPADENSNLARNETAIHSNGDLSGSHYDMNAVFVDALFRHLLWTGDRALMREAWSVIERHLAWERRLFRRPFGADKLPLYEAYAQIWASDDIAYNGGGVAYASAYNLFHNAMAARIATLLGKDAAPYTREAGLIGRAMRQHLWLADRGHFAEYKDLLGRQMVHPSAGLWSFYHVVDSSVPSPREASAMAAAIERDMPRLPITGEGVPRDAAYGVYATTDWMPYSWSVNNVVMGENLHTALALWQAGRPAAAFTLAKSALLASMYMGVTPGNVGSMNYLDVYRRESQRDFADSGGVTARAFVEGLFGVRPDALAGTLHVAPGFPAAWNHATLRHPGVGIAFRRDGRADRWRVSQAGAVFRRLTLRLPRGGERLVSAQANGRAVRWRDEPGAVMLDLPFNAAVELTLRWGGAAPPATETPQVATAARAEPSLPATVPAGLSEPIDLSRVVNDPVTAIFAKGKYRTPRSPFASLALPAQGLGAWAGHVSATATIDDSGLHRVAAAAGGRLVLPDGGWFRIPAQATNTAFVSQWDNYPRAITLPIAGRARAIRLLMAGTTNPMQSRIDNGEVVVTYRDGGTARLALYNPTTWWPIERDYLTDDFQFRSPGPPPLRVDLKTGRVRTPALRSRVPSAIDGGAASVLTLPLDPDRPLRSVTVRALANEVVIGTLAASLVR